MVFEGGPMTACSRVSVNERCVAMPDGLDGSELKDSNMLGLSFRINALSGSTRGVLYWGMFVANVRSR